MEQANTRSSSLDYDLAYSEKTQRFRVSPAVYDGLDIQNNGLTLTEDPEQERLILAIEPNEQAVMHRGKEGTKKGREFTASKMRTKLDQYGFKGVNKFRLEHVAIVDGIRYMEITSEQTGEKSSPDDPVPVDTVPETSEAVSTDSPQQPVSTDDPEQPSSPIPETEDPQAPPDSLAGLEPDTPAQGDWDPSEDIGPPEGLGADEDDDEDDLDNPFGSIGTEQVEDPIDEPEPDKQDEPEDTDDENEKGNDDFGDHDDLDSLLS